MLHLFLRVSGFVCFCSIFVCFCCMCARTGNYKYKRNASASLSLSASASAPVHIRVHIPVHILALHVVSARVAAAPLTDGPIGVRDESGGVARGCGCRWGAGESLIARHGLRARMMTATGFSAARNNTTDPTRDTKGHCKIDIKVIGPLKVKFLLSPDHTALAFTRLNVSTPTSCRSISDLVTRSTLVLGAGWNHAGCSVWAMA